MNSRNIENSPDTPRADPLPHAAVNNDRALSDLTSLVQSSFRTESPQRMQVYLDTAQTGLAQLVDQFRNDSQIVTGEVEGFTFTRTFRGGKQQPVAGFKLEFPDGFSAEIVLRPVNDSSAFLSRIDSAESLQKHFPHVYAIDRQPSATPVLVIEKLNGSHEWAHPQQFAASIASEDGLNQLVNDIYHAYRDLLDQGFVITDIAPVLGHNVMFMPESGAYRLFDVDTVARQSEDSHAFRFQSAVHIHRSMSEAEISFTMQMIKRYDEDHPGALVRAESAMTREGYAYIKNLSTLKVMPKGWELIDQDNPDFERAKVNYGDNPFAATSPGEAYLRRPEREVFEIDPEILSACKSGDRESFIRRVKSLRNTLGTTTRSKE